MDPLASAPHDGFFVLADSLLSPLLRAAAKTAAAAARALHRAYCVRRETRVASLLGIPAPGDVLAVWAPPRRSLRQALLIGSKLADLTPAHPATLRRAAPGTRGRGGLRGRDGGLKQYFADNLPGIPYSTAMRYRRLALRVLRVVGAPAALPLEWMLSGAPADALTSDPDLAAALRIARRKLAGLLFDVASQRALSRRLDRRADTDRLPSADNAQETALRDELIRRGETRLAAAVASGLPLSPAEKRARALLKRLRSIAAAIAKT